MTAAAPTLTDFLLARIAEDDAVARAATQGPWTASGDDVSSALPHPNSVGVNPFGFDLATNYVAQTSYDNQSGTTYNSVNDAIHIARHDPARVLAECEAKREILADPLLQVFMGGTGLSVAGARIARSLALPYHDHPDYRDEWRP